MDLTAKRRALALLLLLNLVALGPTLASPWATALYYDNAPHLAELSVLAQQLPLGHVAMSGQLNAGTAVGQLNAPLAWMPLALLERVGLGLPGYLAAIFASNLLLSVGVMRLGERWTGSASAGLGAGVLALASIADLYGVAGAASGMWPHRLANGVFLLGWPLLFDRIDRRRAGWIALWLGACALLHTFTAVVALGAAAAVVLARGVKREPDAGWLGVSVVGALALSAGLWLPLVLEPELREIWGGWTTGVKDTLLLLSLALRPGPWILHGDLQPVGGAIGWSSLALPTLGLVGLALGRKQLSRPSEVTLFALGLGGLLLGAAVLKPLLDFSLLGPNPWRHYTWWRVAMALGGGLLLARLPRPQWSLPAVGLTLAGLAAAVGVQELPGDRDLVREAEQAWAALPPGDGRVLHQDAYARESLPALRNTHLGAAFSAATGAPVVGSWYSVTPTPTVGWTNTEAGLLLGVPQADAADDWVAGRLGLYGIDRVVTVEPELRAQMLRLGAEPVHQGPTFAVFSFPQGRRSVLGAPPPANVELLEASDTRLVARVDSQGPTPLRLRMAWHPWWRATLDGAPLPLTQGESNGLVQAELPHGGEVILEWTDRGRWAWGLSLAALAALLGLSLVPPRAQHAGG